MNDEKKVIYPNELLEKMAIEGTIFPENANGFGVANLSHLDGVSHILRIYQLFYNNKEEGYEFIQELAAFTFQSKIEMTSFIQELPHLGGIEMLMLLNPLHLGNVH